MRRWSTLPALRSASRVRPATAGHPRRWVHSGLAHKPAPAEQERTDKLNAAQTTTASHKPTLPSSTKAPSAHAFLDAHLERVRTTLLNLLGSSHPALTEIARYYFLHPSKQLRPLLVLLFASATNGLGSHWASKHWAAQTELAEDELDRPLTRPDVLNDWNPAMPDHTASFSSVFPLQVPPSMRTATGTESLLPPSPYPTYTPPLHGIPHLELLPTQMRLAQIVEMIHVASLLHDDVIDNSSLRRSAPSAPAAFGNKLSILGGDFLLGRASAALARLGDSEVVELIAGVIANLVEGEILQMKDVHAAELVGMGVDVGAVGGTGKIGLETYLNKTYLKTASLMAKGARASVILGGCAQGEPWKEIAYAYGRNLGIAFQVSLFISVNRMLESSTIHICYL
jgi:hexaprenyl-diphosphate synthase